jgi:predicted nucleic acid-binding protein
VLIALFDGSHVHHEVAHDWFADNRGLGWATAPLTENALLRIVSNPSYGRNSERAVQLNARLRAFLRRD